MLDNHIKNLNGWLVLYIKKKKNKEEDDVNYWFNWCFVNSTCEFNWCFVNSSSLSLIVCTKFCKFILARSMKYSQNHTLHFFMVCNLGLEWWIGPIEISRGVKACSSSLWRWSATLIKPPIENCCFKLSNIVVMSSAKSPLPFAAEELPIYQDKSHKD